MKVEIFSVLDYNGNKNNEPEMLPMYLEHYTKNFPNSKINIFMCNFPTNYNGSEVSLLKKYGCHIKTIEFPSHDLFQYTVSKICFFFYIVFNLFI